MDKLVLKEEQIKNLRVRMDDAHRDTNKVIRLELISQINAIWRQQNAKKYENVDKLAPCVWCFNPFNNPFNKVDSGNVCSGKCNNAIASWGGHHSGNPFSSEGAYCDKDAYAKLKEGIAIRGYSLHLQSSLDNRAGLDFRYTISM